MRPKAMQALASHTSGGGAMDIYIHTDMTTRRDVAEAIVRAIKIGRQEKRRQAERQTDKL